METLLQDLRFSGRMMLRSRAFTLVAIFALALGIGANSAIFSVVNAVLLRPLAYEEPDRLMILWEKARTQDTSVAYLNFVDWRDQNQSFSDLVAFRRESFNLTEAGEPERLSGRMVSAAFFRTFGASPAMGRDFLEEEDRPGSAPVVILSHGFWKRRFGSDPGVLNSQLMLSKKSYTVVGILPESFQFGAGADVYVPIGHFADRYQQRGSHPGIYLIGRLKPGVTEEQARADMDAIMARLGEQYPMSNADRRTHLESLYENTVQGIRPTLFILLGAVGFVLLIACANVANLLLARAAVRQKEIAIRTALGASRWRVVRQLLTESVLLSLVGGTLGLLIALWGTDFLVSTIPDSIPRLAEAGIDVRVLVFTLVVSVITGLVFGLVPAFQASKTSLNESLKEGDRGSTGGRHRVRSVLVVAEVALALVLLIGAGLMIRSFIQLNEIDKGFNPTNLLTMSLSVATKPDEANKVKDFFEQLHQNVSRLPGVESVTYSNGLPFLGAIETSFQVEGRPPADNAQPNMTVEYFVHRDYFKTLGIKTLKGRTFTEQDKRESPPVVVIDETLANQYFPGEDPVGKRLGFTGPNAPMFEIIGIVDHVKHYGIDGEVPVDPQFYLLFDQVPNQFVSDLTSRMALTARTSGDPMSLVSAIRGEVMAADKNQPVFAIQTMDRVIEQSIAARRFSMQLLIIFAVVALVLAAVGIYGVMSYSVTQRTHEIGIRMALGAERRDIIRLVVGQGLILTLAGVGIGVIAAFALTRVMSSLLFGVSVTDPVTFAALSAVITIVAIAACYIPARRATKVDPMIALRYE